MLVVQEEDYLMYDDFLEHHGVKGMKWGVRRQQARKGQAPIPKSVLKGIERKRDRFNKRNPNPTEDKKRIFEANMQATKDVYRYTTKGERAVSFLLGGALGGGIITTSVALQRMKKHQAQNA